MCSNGAVDPQHDITLVGDGELQGCRGTREAVVAEDRTEQRSGRRWRLVLGIAALALLPWGLAAVVVGGSGQAHAAAVAQPVDDDAYIAVPQNGGWGYVKLSMLVLDDGTGRNLQADIDAEKAAILARFPGSYEMTNGEVTAQYILTGFKWVGGLAGWAYNSSGEPGGIAGSALPAISAAAQTWNMTGASFHFVGGATTTAGTGACGAGGTDGHNTIGWAAQTGNVLAVTCSWYGGTKVGGFSPASEFDMQISPTWQWTTSSSGVQVDLQSVVTHELGHALGLQHSDNGSGISGGTPGPHPEDVMYSTYTAGTIKQSLSADDIAGEMAIYPPAGGGLLPTSTPVTATPTNTARPSPTATATATNPPGNGNPTSTPPATATATPTQPPSGEATNTPTATPTASPSSTATATASASATATPTQTATPTPSGSATPPVPSLPIVPGANLLSWPGGDMPVAVAVANQHGALRAVYTWDASTNSWLRYIPGVPDYVNTLINLHRGTAYWFIASAAMTIQPGD